MTKFCKKCRKTKDISEFNKDRYKKDGIRPECKSCHRQTKRKWNKNNREKRRGYSKKRNRTDKARFSSGKANARQRKLSWKLTFDEWKEIVIGKRCHYCDGDLSPTGASLDRKDNNIGYLLDNVVPCCPDCNTIKADILTYEEMLAVAKLLKEMSNH